MKTIYKIVFIFFMLSSICGSAQDMHFSQFYNSPLTLNPANTGIFTGRYRVSTNYKNQWKSISNTYSSTFAGFDLNIPQKKLGVGLTFFNDKAGKSQMGVTQGNLSLSYNLQVNGGNNIIAGLQYGVGQRSIKTDDLKWDSQFNGTTHDPSIASGETNYSSAYTYMDVSAGIMWNYTANHSQSKFKNSLGVALFHANQPAQSYNSTEKMYYKLVAHISNQFKISVNDIYLLPQLMYSKQGPYTEINTGALVKFILGEVGGDLIKINRVDKRYSNAAAFIGGQLRYKDAFIVMGAFEFRKGLMLSTSYDINISKLNVATKLRGGAEIAILYRGYF
jgi:type IX secretion system PorP/SprF family membrane protein